jgi:dTDP-4-amino-4,6-dideoxygalactose transaminase
VSTQVPFFRPDIGEPEIQEVVAALRSGWLTTGPRVKRFEEEFAAAVGARHAVALNSCTAALHLAVHALGLKPGDGVLVPTMTFAATAEVVRYEGGIPILVDCEADTFNIDLEEAERTIARVRSGKAPGTIPPDIPIVGIVPVHVGGFMLNVDALESFASRHGLWVVEDAAHAFPAAWRRSAPEQWRQCGERTAALSCFSFYANKTITTGEGGMAVTDDADLAARVRLLSLHGLSNDAWGRYSGTGSWDYRILAPGYKYNMTDVAAAVGVHQLAKAEAMRRAREAVAFQYLERFGEVEEMALPVVDSDRLHAWHLFPIRLQLERLAIDRNQFMRELHQRGVSCSVHWRPLHLHPYYEQTFGWRQQDLPVASRTWDTLVSLPLFSAMRQDEVDTVVNAVKDLCAQTSRAFSAGRR